MATYLPKISVSIFTSKFGTIESLSSSTDSFISTCSSCLYNLISKAKLCSSFVNTLNDSIVPNLEDTTSLVTEEDFRGMSVEENGELTNEELDTGASDDESDSYSDED